ncbi:MAG TPA: hypothetical protein VFZ53_29260 [Polyangiaceae bacterium]
MSVLAHLARLGRWRWATSVLLVGAACVPVLAATLLIPSEIVAPWDGGKRRPEARSGAEPAQQRSSLRSKRAFEATRSRRPAPQSDEERPGTAAATNDTSPSTHGRFVPEGERDASELPVSTGNAHE